MKTETITRALRNSTSPAAKLAVWQNHTPAFRRHKLSGGTFRRETFLRHFSGVPELSSPESPRPLMWVTEISCEIARIFSGKSLKMRNAGAWYTDDCGGETIETVAVILTRFPKIIFYGVRESCNDQIQVELSDWEALDFDFVSSEYGAEDERKTRAAEIISSYDRQTETEAEAAQADYVRENAKFRTEENDGELENIATEMSVLTEKLADLAVRRAELRAENARLASEI